MMTGVHQPDPSFEASPPTGQDSPAADLGEAVDPAAGDASSREEPSVAEKDVDPQVLARRAEIVRQAREATEGRPELADLIERVEALEGVDLQHHGETLDAVHGALREALAGAGREDSGTS